MNSFRYQAIGDTGATVSGLIEAEDRKNALARLGEKGLFPSSLEVCAPAAKESEETTLPEAPAPGVRFGSRVKRKEITAFTREMSALLGSAIPIPQALDGLGEEEENPTLKAVVLQIADSVRKGAALSTALEEHPQLFGKLYVSMVRVGEEAGVLPKVMAELQAAGQKQGEELGRQSMMEVLAEHPEMEKALQAAAKSFERLARRLIVLVGGGGMLL